ncbi:MAG TPA: mannitol dehydrogenase family protein, partial [Caulobacteraceae bacterium]|nr:mannitol dehydrogenase family protein [Caulobacteraceae bacterium]
QAFYFDTMLAQGHPFAELAVSLRTPDLARALTPQHGLYTLVEQAEQPNFRVIGCIAGAVSAAERPREVLAALADPGIHTVTMTVTEKGYCLEAGGDLDVDHPDVKHDLARGAVAKSLVGWLAQGLRARRDAAGGGLNVISCDNLSDNGAKLSRALRQFLEAGGQTDLARWVEGEVLFPSTMVDSITPATDQALRAQVDHALGVLDAWPVQREPFLQWVIEDRLGPRRSAFVEAGVTLTDDVAGYERAKLRLLNGAHSTLAYLGLALGHQTVAEAMADADLARLIERMMRDDIAPVVGRVEGLDLTGYIADVIARFRNPAVVHRLSQIAWDGSQKLPIRLLPTAMQALRGGRPVERFAVATAAWLAFISATAAARAPLTDPMADELLELGREGSARNFLQLRAVFPERLAADAGFAAAVELAFGRLRSDKPRAVLDT